MILEIKKSHMDKLEQVLKEYKESTDLVKGGDGMFKYSIKEGSVTTNPKATIIAFAPSANVIKPKKEEDK